jgi:hypothetical protein
LGFHLGCVLVLESSKLVGMLRGQGFGGCTMAFVIGVLTFGLDINGLDGSCKGGEIEDERHIQRAV